MSHATWMATPEDALSVAMIQLAQGTSLMPSGGSPGRATPPLKFTDTRTIPLPSITRAAQHKEVGAKRAAYLTKEIDHGVRKVEPRVPG